MASFSGAFQGDRSQAVRGTSGDFLLRKTRPPNLTEMTFEPEKEGRLPFEAYPAVEASDTAAVQAVTQNERHDDSHIHVPPDGGLHAWLKVLGGFLIYSNIW